jgi:phosphoribosylanthranilate isomerase
LIVDAHVAGAYGGTGTLADWQRAAVLAQQQPFLLAGGLKPDNVAEAIAQVQPYGVDVSSGVEVDGRKDTALIESFIHTARAASLQR